MSFGEGDLYLTEEIGSISPSNIQGYVYGGRQMPYSIHIDENDTFDDIKNKFNPQHCPVPMTFVFDGSNSSNATTIIKKVYDEIEPAISITSSGDESLKFFDVSAYIKDGSVQEKC